MRTVSRGLTVAFVVLLLCKLTNSPGLPWWQVLAPIWLPILAAFTLPLVPAYRRYAMRKGWVGGESPAIEPRPRLEPAADADAPDADMHLDAGDCNDRWEEPPGSRVFWYCGRPAGHLGDHELHGRIWPRRPPVMRRRS